MRKNNKKILITGAGGFIGNRLLKALLHKGYEAVGVDFGKRGFLQTDVRNFDATLRIIKSQKPEAVFHLAAALPPESAEEENPLLYFDVNIRGTFNVLEACRLAGVKKIIYSSSMSVYGKKIKYLPVDEKHPAKPDSFYGLSKLFGEEIAELYAKKYGMKIICLRYGGAFGGGRSRGAVSVFAKNALLGKPLHIFQNMSWDLTWVEDIIKANILAFQKINKFDFEIFNIGSGKETSLDNLAKEIIKMINSKSKIEFDKRAPKSRFYMDVKKARNFLSYCPANQKKCLFKYINFLKNDYNPST